MKAKKKYSFGEVHSNKYTGAKLVEILSLKNHTVGWLWELTDGRIVVSPHLGFYIWYDGKGNEWDIETGAKWLCQSYNKIARG